MSLCFGFKNIIKNLQNKVMKIDKQEYQINLENLKIIR